VVLPLLVLGVVLARGVWYFRDKAARARIKEYMDEIKEQINKEK
jgi:hypothetical protein